MTTTVGSGYLSMVLVIVLEALTVVSIFVIRVVLIFVCLILRLEKMLICGNSIWFYLTFGVKRLNFKLIVLHFTVKANRKRWFIAYVVPSPEFQRSLDCSKNTVPSDSVHIFALNDLF